MAVTKKHVTLCQEGNKDVEYYPNIESENIPDGTISEQQLDSTLQNKLNGKADASNTYTKSETDTLLNAKANQSTTYTKSETDTLLNAKANQSTTYTKTQVDLMVEDIHNQLDLKDNAINNPFVAIDGGYESKSTSPLDININDNINIPFSKIYDDGDASLENQLNAKANQSTTYTKTEINNLNEHNTKRILLTAYRNEDDQAFHFNAPTNYYFSHSSNIIMNIYKTSQGSDTCILTFGVGTTDLDVYNYSMGSHTTLDTIFTEGYLFSGEEIYIYDNAVKFNHIDIIITISDIDDGIYAEY